MILCKNQFRNLKSILLREGFAMAAVISMAAATGWRQAGIELSHKICTTLGTVWASKPCSCRTLVYWPKKTAFITSSLCKFLLKSV